MLLRQKPRPVRKERGQGRGTRLSDGLAERVRGYFRLSS